MYGLPSSPFYNEFLVFQTALDLADRSLDREGFEEHISEFIKVVSINGGFVSEDLKDLEKVNFLIEDFKKHYLNKEKDPLSHKLMRSLIQHPPVSEKTFKKIENLSHEIFSQFPGGANFLKRSDSFAAHLFLTLFHSSINGEV